MTPEEIVDKAIAQVKDVMMNDSMINKRVAIRAVELALSNSNKITLLDKKYDWESLSDLERDCYESISDSNHDIPGEYEGTINVNITYEDSQ